MYRVSYVSGRNRPEGKVLETVGVFESVKQHGKYETGQVRHTLNYKGVPISSLLKVIEVNFALYCHVFAPSGVFLKL